MGLDYEEYARELKRVEMENEARGDYENDDLKEMNQQEEQPAEPANIRVENRRVQRDAPKPQQKEKDEWADDDMDGDLGL
jgi:hypothetical protein